MRQVETGYTPLGQEEQSDSKYNWRKYITKERKEKCAKGYALWITFALVTVLGLYLDFRCEGHHIMPKQWIYIPTDANVNDDCICDESKAADISQKHFVNSLEQVTAPSPYQCINDVDCNNGVCTSKQYFNGTVYGSKCVCNTGYITINDDICNYQQIIGLTALLLSIFVGGCGIDRCYMSRGNGCWICMGIVKGITAGGCGIWWIVDLVLIATAQLPDGNGQPLSPIGS